jgi:hypothetical protein
VHAGWLLIPFVVDGYGVDVVFGDKLTVKLQGIRYFILDFGVNLAFSSLLLFDACAFNT